MVAWGIKDIFDGVTGRAYQKIARPENKLSKLKADNEDKKIRAVAEEPQVVRYTEKQKMLSKKRVVARSAKLKAKVARLKARALEKKYQASLAEAQAAEAIAESKELELELMRAY